MKFNFQLRGSRLNLFLPNTVIVFTCSLVENLVYQNFIKFGRTDFENTISNRKFYTCIYLLPPLCSITKLSIACYGIWWGKHWLVMMNKIIRFLNLFSVLSLLFTLLKALWVINVNYKYKCKMYYFNYRKPMIFLVLETQTISFWIFNFVDQKNLSIFFPHEILWQSKDQFSMIYKREQETAANSI